MLPRPRSARGFAVSEIASDIAHPLADAATVVRHRVHVESLGQRLLQRGLEILPLALALTLITSLVWGAFFLPVPLVVMLLGFDLYWAWRSMNIGIHTFEGYRAMKAASKVDWRQRYDAETLPFGPLAADNGRDARPDLIAWDDVHHLVIIPTYKETVEKLRATLGKLAESEVAHEKLLVVIAMEERGRRGSGSLRDLAARVRPQLRGDDRHDAPVGHPRRGARQVVERGVGGEEGQAAVLRRDGLQPRPYDRHELRRRHAVPPRYFSALTYYFATNPRRYRRFWQGPIFYYNNVWDVPAPLRIQNSLGGINHLAKLVRKYTVLFPQSTYSLSLRMCHDVGYWDVDVVPEDWHMFLKCFFELGGEPDVQPILLPVGNDGVRAISYKRHVLGALPAGAPPRLGLHGHPVRDEAVPRPPGDPVPAAPAPDVEPHREPRAVVVAVVPHHGRRREHVRQRLERLGGPQPSPVRAAQHPDLVHHGVALDPHAVHDPAGRDDHPRHDDATARPKGWKCGCTRCSSRSGC